MEKIRLLRGRDVEEPRNAGRSSKWRIVAIVISTYLTYLVWLQWRSRGKLPCQHERKLQYEGEHIQWEVCGYAGDRPLECSSIDVPMDHFADKPSEKTFRIPLIRLRGKNATENILTNPGGPGEGGVGFLRGFGETLQRFTGENYHLVSFDPRGVGASQPPASCYPDAEKRQTLSRVRAKKLEEDSPELYAWTRNYARACAETMGEHGKYINTPQTAADMNSILDALGQKDMVYWGFSYGTILGQTYAGMFPERSKRIIIDGVVNQFSWYEGHFAPEELDDADAVLAGFFDECIKAGDNCPLTSLYSTKKEISHKITALAEQLSEQPVSVYLNATVYGLLDEQSFWIDGVRNALYDADQWRTFAEKLTKLLQGDATDFYVAYGQSPRDDRIPDSYRFIRLNDFRTGPEHWPQDRKAFLEELMAFSNQTIFALAEMKHYYAAQSWLIPRTHPYVPRYDVKTAHPILIFSMTFDPVAPLENAQNATFAFASSRLVEVRGYGHCTLRSTSACAIKYLQEYLHDGTLPESNVQCGVDTPYFSDPKGDADILNKYIPLAGIW
ncbi:alpha/beta-hydrolase [Thozetella sp. PMI_491]|nr:alpha/beta-hydrolase [Thozetella sp. PMI_491]